MSNLYFTDATNTIVSRVNAGGGIESMLASALPAGTAVLPYVKPSLTVTDFDDALTQHLDSTAQARRYDNRVTCALRAGYPGPFQAEGQAFASWMDTCNALGYKFLAEVQAGTRPLPATTQEFIDALPPMVWPTSSTT